jgi:hypothetical protein
MDKRDFIKSSMLMGLAASLPLQPLASTSKSKARHWVWVNPNVKDEQEALNERYSKYYKAGIKGIFFEADSEKHFRAAKRNKLEAHRWMWTLNRGEKSLLESHPEWYAVSRNGKSCADQPPYVNYYRWLCPSKPETLNYLKEQVNAILQNDYVDGIHLDYVRYCDVILPVNLWDTYKIEQNQELPEYDFCYCDTCRSNFKKLKGIDPLQIKHPDQSLSWRKYRYDRVTFIVNELSKVAKTFRKPITAAVFPTPEVAKRIVRQDWTQWNLDAVFPMIYHGFYKEDVSWIGDAVEEGLSGLAGKFPLYAGLFLPDFADMNELRKGIDSALRNGASGVSLFGNITDQILEVLSKPYSK